EAKVRDGASAVQEKVVRWRRDIHQHPELGDQETRTAGLVADHLRKLGLDVRTGVGGTGVVGVLRGAKPGRTVALRADMDALPGTVLFVFQPAEEGSSVVTPASGKTWGARRMLDEGAFKDPKPDFVFALHVMPGPSGQIAYRTGATTASSDDLQILVTGKQ